MSALGAIIGGMPIVIVYPTNWPLRGYRMDMDDLESLWRSLDPANVPGASRSLQLYGEHGGLSWEGHAPADVLAGSVKAFTLSSYIDSPPPNYPGNQMRLTVDPDKRSALLDPVERAQGHGFDRGPRTSPPPQVTTPGASPPSRARRRQAPS